ncbi:MAG: hypothetical protein ACTSPY_16545 [Candidatus Helarchaeota archaeon]
MVKNKLNFFLKQLGNVGSKFYYNMNPKINFMLLLLIVRSTIQEYTNTLKSMEKGLDRLGTDVQTEASSVVMDLILNPIMFGIKMAVILSKDISDTAYMIHLTLKALIGSKAVKYMFDKPVFIPAEENIDKIPRVVIGIKNCPLCCGIEDKITPDMIGESDYLTVITSLGQAAVQNVEDYVGNSYRIVCKETKCRCRGDTKGELTVFFYAKE